MTGMLEPAGGTPAKRQHVKSLKPSQEVRHGRVPTRAYTRRPRTKSGRIVREFTAVDTNSSGYELT